MVPHFDRKVYMSEGQWAMKVKDAHVIFTPVCAPSWQARSSDRCSFHLNSLPFVHPSSPVGILSVTVPVCIPILYPSAALVRAVFSTVFECAPNALTCHPGALLGHRAQGPPISWPSPSLVSRVPISSDLQGTIRRLCIVFLGHP